MDGRFKLTIPAGKHKLNFSFIGMKPVQQTVEGDMDITVVMEEDAAELEEVVVTGMEIIKKDYMTGSASVITAKDLKTQGITSVDRILEGTIAGLNSTRVSGAPGTRAQITIRGENNLSGNTEPLWIVDGLPLMSGVPENNTGDYAGTIMQDGVGNIMPEDIESISILKDASAAAIYGAKAANGVIVITTKKGFRSKTQFNYTGNSQHFAGTTAAHGFYELGGEAAVRAGFIGDVRVELCRLDGEGRLPLQAVVGGVSDAGGV